MLVFEPVSTLLDFFAERAGTPRPDAVPIGGVADGALRFVAVFDTFSVNHCHMHIAAEGRKWFSAEAAAGVFAYPFMQCGFARVTATISVMNRTSLALAYHAGFQREGVIRDGGRHGEDLVLLGMLRRECRYLPLSARQTRVKGDQAAQDERPTSGDGGH